MFKAILLKLHNLTFGHSTSELHTGANLTLLHILRSAALENTNTAKSTKLYFHLPHLSTLPTEPPAHMNGMGDYHN